MNTRTYFFCITLLAFLLGSINVAIKHQASYSQEESHSLFYGCEVMVDEQLEPRPGIIPKKTKVAYWLAHKVKLKEIKIYAIPLYSTSNGPLSARAVMNATNVFYIRIKHSDSLKKLQAAIRHPKLGVFDTPIDHRLVCILIYEDESKELMGMDKEGNFRISGVKFEYSKEMHQLLLSLIPASYTKWE